MGMRRRILRRDMRWAAEEEEGRMERELMRWLEWEVEVESLLETLDVRRNAWVSSLTTAQCRDLLLSDTFNSEC